MAKIIQFPGLPKKDSLLPASDAPGTLTVPEFIDIPIDTMLLMCGWVLLNMKDGDYCEIADNLLEEFMEARDNGSVSGTHPVSTKFAQNVFARAMVESDLRFAKTIDKLEQLKKEGLFKS